MIMTTSRHDNIVAQKDSEIMMCVIKYNLLLERWNSLAQRINSLGGEEFLSAGAQLSLTKDDLNRLLMLIHPDKHDGKPLAQDMTKKVLELRNNINY